MCQNYRITAKLVDLMPFFIYNIYNIINAIVGIIKILVAKRAVSLAEITDF